MKVTLIALGTILTFASCKKDYSCECSTNGETTGYLIENETKPRASTICSDYATETMLNSQGNGGSCVFIEP